MKDSLERWFVLKDKFSQNELKEICFELRIDHENIPADNKAAFARELIDYLERRERIEELDEIVCRMRPKTCSGKEISVINVKRKHLIIAEILKVKFDHLVANDDIEEALSTIKRILEESKLDLDSFITLSGRWNAAKKDDMEGILDREKFATFKNKFRKDLLNFWKEYFG